MSDVPQMSVLLPVSNGMPYVIEAVESILEQTFVQFELVVVDNGSTDQTPEYLQNHKDPRIQYHRLDKPSTTEALRYGLEMVRAPIVARMDADDLAEPTRFERQIAYLNEHPDCVLLGCQAVEINNHGDREGQRDYPLSDPAIRWQMIFGCPFVHPGVMYRIEPVRACGGYDSKYACAQDYDLWTRLARQGTLANLPERLIRYRVHAESVTTNRMREQIENCSRIAAGYVEHIAPGIDRNAIADLFHFHAEGTLPQQTTSESITRSYGQLKRVFLQQICSPNEELDERIALIQRNLRWRCLEEAQRNWWNPVRAACWIRRAGRFDPEAGTVGKILQRSIRKLAGNA